MNVTTRPKVVVRIFVFAAVLVGAVPPASPYEKATHAVLAETALTMSSAGDVLKTALHIDGGLDYRVAGRALSEFARAGSRAEDAFPRFTNHFHDPLRPWDEAGWRVSVPYLPLLGLRLGDSAVVWAQKDAALQGWSWNAVRRHYLEALTLPSKVERDGALARTFEGLGRLAHLVQDAASPAHTRNDPHVRANYETFVGELTDSDLRALAASPVVPDPGWTSQPANALAPVPVSALFDADVYTGSNPQATVAPLVGLAEYTNANFFSEDSAFGRTDIVGRYFPYPASSSATITAEPVVLSSGETVLRLYYRKDGDGDTGYRLATVGLLQAYEARTGTAATPKPFLDDAVYADYAARLIPRAVGYSTALIDYFFRGRLGVFVVSGDADLLLIQNLTDEPMEGVFELHAIRGDGRELVASFGSTDAPRRLGPWGVLPELLTTSFAPAKRFLLLFRGRMGTESASPGYPGAVAAVVFEVQFVFTVQQSFDGPAAQFDCQRHLSHDAIERTHSGSLRCYWLPQQVRIPGYFRTNWDKPIIQRVTLRGGGSSSRTPALVVDGVAQTDGVWSRAGVDQADPQTFVVTDSGIDRTPSYWIDVQTTNGTIIETQLAVIDIGGSLVGRAKDYIEETEGYLVWSSRNAWVGVSTETWADSAATARFRTESINGRTNPTTPGARVYANRRYAEGTRVDDTTWVEDIIDFFAPFHDSDEADRAYGALPGLDAFVDPILENRPAVAWTASVARDYSPADLDFFRRFGITPISYVIPLSAR